MLKNKLLTLCSLLFISFVSLNVSATQTPLISQTELLKLLSEQEAQANKEHDSSFIVLDVRTPAEFKQGHIKNAINISHNKVKDNLSMLAAHKNKMIVVHCRSGRRAISAEKVLQESGFSNVRHLEGDMNAWMKMNLPIEK